MAVTITTYTNASEADELTKDITIVDNAVSAVIKDTVELVRPTLILSNNLSQDFNYVYIAEFDRYYYVRSRSFAQQRYIINLEVDPLMSFKSEIEALTIIAKRSSSTFNVFQVDSEVPRVNRNIIATQPFPAGFSDQSIILATSGG